MIRYTTSVTSETSTELCITNIGLFYKTYQELAKQYEGGVCSVDLEEEKALVVLSTYHAASTLSTWELIHNYGVTPRLVRQTHKPNGIRKNKDD